MIRSIIHAGGESTRLREAFSGPKALLPINEKPLIWFHLQPLLKSNKISEYIFTLRCQHEAVQNYVNKLGKENGISTKCIVEPKPLGRAGVVRLGIEKGIIDVDVPHLMSHPDDLVPFNLGELIDYASEAERKNKSLIMIMAKHAINPFGIGVVKKVGDIVELKTFKEKPELPLIENHLANTGVTLFLPEAMKEFKNVPLDRMTHPEHEIVPKLVKENKVVVFPVERWLSINYESEYKDVLKMGEEKLLKFLNV